MKGENGLKFVLITLLAVLLCAGLPVASGAQTLTPNQQLGKLIFFDDNLSFNRNQSCASCHAPEAGWTGADADINLHGSVYEGSISGRFGDRKPPSSAYATQSPVFHYVIKKKEALFVGGNFWDGRATGEKLGNPAADQAQGPFLNPLEQALATPGDVVTRVCEGAYADLFKAVWGNAICESANIDIAYDSIALSIAAYEGSPESNAFTSKYDYSLKGKAKLTKQERLGFSLFQGKGKCKLCHVSNGQKALFTDYTFDNLGVPRNPENPFYTSSFNPNGYDWIDPGLGGFLASRLDYAEYADVNMGKHKVPTLRNVDKWDVILGARVKAYGHNGYFKSLWGIVHFYNTRDVLPLCPDDYTEAEALAANCWPAPEVAVNVNTAELGNLGLTQEEEEAIVEFLKALSDGYIP